MEIVCRSSLIVIPLSPARSMVMPPAIFDAPANAAWPPDLTAKGQLVLREMRTADATSCELSGRKTQAGKV